jgi:pilus assembly protein CpaC
MQIMRSIVSSRRLYTAGLPILVVAVFGRAVVSAQVAQTALAVAPVSAPALAPMPASTSTPTPAVDADGGPSSDVRLVAGRSTLVDVGSPIARVSLTSADIADAMVTSPSQLLVHGKTPGSISMFVWSRGGAVRRYEIAVQRDVTRLADQMRQLFPTEQIQVHSNGRNVVLSGTVANKDVIEKAMSVALGIVEKRDDVVSLLQVREARRSDQVLLRVRFAEVNRSALTEFGMSFFTSPTGVKNTLGRVSTQQYAAPGFTDLEWTKSSSDFGAPVDSAKGKFAFSDFLNLFLFSERYDLGTMIRAMQNRGLFESLAEPNLVAQSGKEASFLAGGEFPIPVMQGSGSNMGVSVQFKEFGIRLNFTPTVNGDRVHLKVRPEVSTLDYGNAVTISGFRIPALSTRRTETELELRDGQTFAIAGLMNNQMSSTLQKVPGIGDIPILGHLFKSKAAQKQQTELVVIITPEILSTESVGVTDSLPRLIEPFLSPVSENRTTPPPAEAFRPTRMTVRGEQPAPASTSARTPSAAQPVPGATSAVSPTAQPLAAATDGGVADAEAAAAPAVAPAVEVPVDAKTLRAQLKRERKLQKAAEKAQREQDERDEIAAALAIREAAKAEKEAAKVALKAEKDAAKAAKNAEKNGEKNAERLADAERQAEEQLLKQQAKENAEAMRAESEAVIRALDAAARQGEAPAATPGQATEPRQDESPK